VAQVATTSSLLERDDELAVLRAVAARARERSGSVVLVAGEAGIGKSSLVAAWMAELDPGSTRVLPGWCDDFLTRRTLGPFRDVARSAGGALAEAVEQADTGAVLDAVLAVLDDPLRAVALVLEDVHWADEATLDVVRYVGRRIRDLPAVLVLTYRDDEVGADHPLTAVLGALAGAPLDRVAPGPLSEEAIATLLGPSGLDPSQVAAVTAGNAFFVTEVARTRGAHVPATVADTVLARARALSDEPRRALEALSVLPRAVSRDVAAAIVGDITLLAPVERRGLLVTTVDHVRFRHELARRAVEDALTVTERVAAHRRVLDVLRARDDTDVMAVLHHAVGAGAHDVVASVGPSAAAEAYRAGAHREAAAIQDQVLTHPDRLAPAVRARLLEERAWTVYNLHRFDEARTAADEAVVLREAGEDRPALVRALLVRSRMEYMRNDPSTALATMDRATTVAGRVEDDRELEADVLVNRAMLLQLIDHDDEAAAIVDDALQAAMAVGREDLEVLALNYRGLLRVVQSQRDEGVADLYAAVTRGRATGQLEPTARSYTNLVEELVRCGRWDEAQRTIDEAIAFYDDHDFVAHRYNTVAHRGLLLLFMGRWDEAEQELRAVHATADQAGVLETLALNGLARLATRRGDPEARDLVEHAWEVALASGAAQYITTIGAARVEWAWLNDHREVVPETVERALRPAAPPQHRAMLLRQLQLSGVDMDVAVDADDAAYLPPHQAALRGDWRAAADGFGALGATYSRALELASSGEVDPMLEALALLDELGAAPAARWVRGRLKELGVRSIPRGPQASTRENPAGLTDRQLDVLRLVAEGRTNAEIADELVLSVRTVDHHVSAVLAKLGVATRQEAAAAATELEVT
jgi:DNA-binding CsgD family transcriptional regulator/tetratricopeptide (TPR) repeat protein